MLRNFVAIFLLVLLAQFAMAQKETSTSKDPKQKENAKAVESKKVTSSIKEKSEKGNSKKEESAKVAAAKKEKDAKKDTKKDTKKDPRKEALKKEIAKKEPLKKDVKSEAGKKTQPNTKPATTVAPIKKQAVKKDSVLVKSKPGSTTNKTIVNKTSVTDKAAIDSLKKITIIKANANRKDTSKKMELAIDTPKKLTAATLEALAKANAAQNAVGEKTFTKDAIVTDAKMVKPLTPWQQRKKTQDSMRDFNLRIAENKKVFIAEALKQKKDSLEKNRLRNLFVMDSTKKAKLAYVEFRKDSIIKAKSVRKELDSLELVDEIIDHFTMQEYQEVVDLSIPYLRLHPKDTNIIIKTGLSLLMTEQYKKGFQLMDTLFMKPDSLIQFYSAIPYVNPNANNPDVYRAIVNHISSIDANNIWTNFTKASYYLSVDSARQALSEAKLAFDKIKTPQQAGVLGFVYPTILYQTAKYDSAILCLEILNNKFPNSTNIEYKLYQYYRKQKRYNEAYNLIKKISRENADIKDFYEDYLELLLILDKKQELCYSISTNNEANQFDAYIYQAGCSTEFVTQQLKFNNSMTWAANVGGQIYNFTFQLAAILTDSLNFNYSIADHNNFNGTISFANASFDTLSSVLFTFPKKMTKKETTVPLWISKKCYQDIVLTGQTYIATAAGNELFTVVSDVEEVITDPNAFIDRIVVNDTERKLFAAYHLVSDDNSQQIWVLKNPKNPMVVKYDNGYTLELKKVNGQ